MYYTHFGLTQPPFRITPNTEFFYGGGNRGPILEALIYAITQGEGIIKVTGEVGSGKTMLCSMLQSRLPPHVETVYLANPSVSPEEILHAIAGDLHLAPPRDAGNLEIMQLIHEHLLHRHAEGKYVVMFVEESQSMPIATLEEMRLLSNLETPSRKLLQIVLFGQPELDQNLRQPQIRQLRDRITHSFRLSPLKPDEIRDYLNFRLRAAGYRGPHLFSMPVVKAIAKASAGLTRRVNVIADKALLAAFSENTHTIEVKHVKAALLDSEFSYKLPRPPLALVNASSLLAIGAAVGIGFALMLTPQKGPVQAPTAAPVAPLVAPQSAPAPAPPLLTALGAPAEPAAKRPTAVTEPAAIESTPVAAEPTPPSSKPIPLATPAAPAVEPAVKPEKKEVSASSQLAAGGPETLETRLASTEKWLAKRAEPTYSIQLLGSENPEQLKQHLNVIAKYVEITDIFVYRTIAREKPSLTVLYGSFGDRRSALEALAKLPPQLKAYKPLVRTVQGIRAEIALHQSS